MRCLPFHILYCNIIAKELGWRIQPEWLFTIKTVFMKEKLVELILKYGIIKTNFKQPITFKSGIRSPIYCNFRECSTHPDLMEVIRQSFQNLFANSGIDCVIGVATGAVPHSSIYAQSVGLPSGYIRPDAKVKDYGLKKMIEGCDVAGKTVGLMEDLVSTGESVISNAQILVKSGAEKIVLTSIFSYEMERSKKEFADAGFKLTSLITIHDVLPFLKNILLESDYLNLLDWVSDPEGWFNRHKLEFDFGFLTQLRQSAKDSGSIICFGSDPVLEALPLGFKGIRGYVDFMEIVFAEMAKNKLSPGMFKPNLAWWVIYDEPWLGKYEGSNALVNLMSNIHDYFPGIPITLDNKTGDIGTSSSQWAKFGYVNWCANSVTVHTYMGSDSVGPFISYCNPEKNKGAYLLVKTTNKGAADLELKKMADGRLVYEQVADNVIGWAKGNPGVGAVTAGNSPEELRILGKKFAGKDIPLLIPGVGPSQGGEAGEIATILRESDYELALARTNLSSGFFPWYKPGQPNPLTEECVNLCVETLRSQNKKIGYIG